VPPVWRFVLGSEEPGFGVSTASVTVGVGPLMASGREMKIRESGGSHSCVSYNLFFWDVTFRCVSGCRRFVGPYRLYLQRPSTVEHERIASFVT
jgi:hypothetical protein